jgi:hypothetical protein
MDKRSAMILAGTLVVALMAGVVAREVTLSHSAPGPIQIVQTSTVPAPNVQIAPVQNGGEPSDG